MTLLLLFLAFLGAFVATMLIGAIAKLAMVFFGIGRAGGFGAFCVAVGSVLGRSSYSGPLDWRALEAGVGLLGSLAALVLLWFWLVKRAPEDAGTARE